MPFKGYFCFLVLAISVQVTLAKPDLAFMPNCKDGSVAIGQSLSKRIEIDAEAYKTHVENLINAVRDITKDQDVSHNNVHELINCAIKDCTKAIPDFETRTKEKTQEVTKTMQGFMGTGNCENTALKTAKGIADNMVNSVTGVINDRAGARGILSSLPFVGGLFGGVVDNLFGTVTGLLSTSLNSVFDTFGKTLGTFMGTTKCAAGTISAEQCQTLDNDLNDVAEVSSVGLKQVSDCVQKKTSELNSLSLEDVVAKLQCTLSG